MVLWLKYLERVLATLMRSVPEMARDEGWLQVYGAMNVELVYQAVGFIVSLPAHFNLHITILLPLLRHLQVLKNLMFSSDKSIVVPKIPVLLEQHACLSAAFPSTCNRRHFSWILCRAFSWTLRCVKSFVPPWAKQNYYSYFPTSPRPKKYIPPHLTRWKVHIQVFPEPQDT